jgi:hypothetical protein
MAPEGVGLGPVVTMAETLGVPMPEFFDPVTGDVRERIQDIRGSDFYCIETGSSTAYSLMVALAPVEFEGCRKQLIEGEESRRDAWGIVRDYREALKLLVEACKYGELLNVQDALTEADEVLRQHGVETWEGES